VSQLKRLATLMEMVCEEAPIESCHAVAVKANSTVSNALRDVQR